MQGGLIALMSGRVLFRAAEVTLPESSDFFKQLLVYPMVVIALWGLAFLAAGLAFLFSPSMRAFFRYQRGRGTA